MWCNLNGIPAPLTELTSLGLRAYRKHYRHSRPPVWYTTDHLTALFSNFTLLQIHHYVLLALSFYTLIRPKEILAIKWQHLFLDKKYIWLPSSKTDQEGQGQYVHLLPPAHHAIATLYSCTSHNPHELIFPICQSQLNDWLHSKCQAANIPFFTWYALKHGGATYLALCGWSLKRITLHGRWKSKETAKIYIHAPLASS